MSVTRTAQPSTPLTAADVERVSGAIERISAAFSSRVVGQARIRTALLVTLLAEGHVLLESVP